MPPNPIPNPTGGQSNLDAYFANNNQPQENWLARAAPTIGAIGGGILGEIAGPVGGIAGASIGGGIGKGIENLASGQDIGKDVLSTAVASGAGQGVGGLAAKAGGAVLGGITGKLGGMVEGRAAQTAADAAAGAEAKAATDATAAAAAKAEAYKNNYGSLSDRLQRDLKLGTNAKHVDAMGFDSTNPADMKTVSNAGLDLNNIYDTALQKAKPVDMSGFGTQIYADMKKNGITDLGTTPLGKAISEAGIPLDQKNLQLPAVQVRKLQQAVGAQIGNTQKLINNAEMQGVSNTEAESQLKNLQDVYKSLGSKIKTPEVDSAIAAAKTTTEDRQALISKYGDTLGNHVADTVDNAQSANHLLTPMQSYTQMSRASDMAGNDITNAIATPRAVARTKADITANAPEPVAATQGQGSNMLDALSIAGIPFTGGVSAIGLAPHALKLAQNPNVQEAAFKGLSKVTGNRTAQKVIPALIKSGAIAGANLPNDASQATGAIPSAQNGTMGGTMQQPQQNPLNQAYQIALAGAGVTPGSADLLNTLSPMIQKQNLAQPIIGAAQQGFQNAGGAQGMIGGGLSELSGLIPGSAANTYQGQQSSAAAAIASLLGISPEAAMQLLPSLMQSQSSAGIRSGALGGITGGIGTAPMSSPIPMAQ